MRFKIKKLLSLRDGILFATISLSGVSAFSQELVPGVSTIAAPEPTKRGAAKVVLPLEIELVGYSQVNSPYIYLNDLVRCRGDEELCAEVEGVSLGESPKPSHRTTFTIDAVRKAIENEFPKVRVTYRGERRVTVTSAYIEINKDVVKQTIENSIRAATIENKDLRVRVTKLDLVKSLKIWPGEYQLRFPLVESVRAQRMDWLVENFVGRKLVDLECYRDARLLVRSKVRVSFETEYHVPVSNRNLALGSMLKHEYFEYKWRALSRRSLNLYLNIKDLVGMRLKRPLRTGKQVFRNFVEVPRIVKRGQTVTVLLVSGPMKIKSRAKALASGGKGELIKVYHSATKKNLYARVLNPSLVEVEL